MPPAKKSKRGQHLHMSAHYRQPTKFELTNELISSGWSEAKAGRCRVFRSPGGNNHRGTVEVRAVLGRRNLLPALTPKVIDRKFSAGFRVACRSFGVATYEHVASARRLALLRFGPASVNATRQLLRATCMETTTERLRREADERRRLMQTPMGAARHWISLFVYVLGYPDLVLILLICSGASPWSEARATTQGRATKRGGTAQRCSWSGD